MSQPDTLSRVLVYPKTKTGELNAVEQQRSGIVYHGLLGPYALRLVKSLLISGHYMYAT